MTYKEWKSEFVDGGDKSGLEKAADSGIIKSLDIDDFMTFARGNNLSEDVSKVIADVIDKFELKGNMYIADVHFGSFFDSSTRKPALMQVFNNRFGLTEMNINSDIMGGKTLDEINILIKNTKGNLPQNLTEAVVHEMGHAKTFYRRSNKQIEELDRKYKDKGIEGISKVAKRDGLECIAEIEVLLYRKEEVSDKAMDLYNSVMKEGFK